MDEWNEVGGAPENFEMHEYGVIYLDILGQKELMKKIESGEASSEDKEKMQEVLKHVREFLKEWAELRARIASEKVETIYKHFFEGRADGVTYEAIKASIEELVLGIQQFSDATMIYIRLDGTYPFVAQQLFSSVLCGLGSALFQSLQKGIFIRGAIVKGSGWEIGEDNLYGPVIHEAHTLETQVARWSRVVVSNEVASLYRKVLCECKQGAQSNEQSVQILESMFVKGLDGVCQLSLFPKCALEKIAFDSSDSGHSQRTLERFFHVVKIINDELKLHQDKLETAPNEIVERSKLILRAKVFKQEVLNGIIRFVDICRDAGSLSEAQWKEMVCRVQKEAHDDMGFNTPLTSIFEE